MMELNALGLLDDADIDLVEAGITLALADRPAADPARLRRLVSGWAIALQRDTAPVSGSGRARLLSGLIASETGLTGATEDYDNPLNADLIALVERGRGLPIASIGRSDQRADRHLNAHGAPPGRGSQGAALPASSHGRGRASR